MPLFRRLLRATLTRRTNSLADCPAALAIAASEIQQGFMAGWGGPILPSVNTRMTLVVAEWLCAAGAAAPPPPHPPPPPPEPYSPHLPLFPCSDLQYTPLHASQ